VGCIDGPLFGIVSWRKRGSRGDDFKQKARVSVSTLRAFLGCPWGRMDLSTTICPNPNREQSHVSWNFSVIAITAREDNEHSAAGLVGAECDLGIRIEHKAVA